MTRQKTNNGFSITEVMVACLALGIMLVPVFMMFSKSSAGTTRNKNDILAQQDAANILAYAYALNYDHDFLKEGTKVVKEKKVKSSDGTDIDLSVTESFFHRTVNIKEYKVSQTSRAYKLISVSVEWDQSSNKDKEKEKSKKKEIKLTGLIYK